MQPEQNSRTNNREMQMDSNSRNGNNSGDSGKGRKENREKKTIKMTFNMSWLYILLIFGIIWI